MKATSTRASLVLPSLNRKVDGLRVYLGLGLPTVSW